MTDPLALLAADRAEAGARQDPCASLCSLATVDEAGQPQVRTLVLRDVAGRLAVFVNATSPKFQCMDRVAVLVWLPSLKVQYRLTCSTQPVPPEVIAGSWQLRPDPPKRLDWLYTRIQAQSSPIESRERLLDALTSLTLPEPLTAPDTAVGLFLVPAQIERLDLDQDNGVHDRRRYTAGNPTWREEILVP